MHNVLVLGTGRSGTSMVAGCFRNSGAYQGEPFPGPPRAANPLGFYEDGDINHLNNMLIYEILFYPKTTRLISWLLQKAHRDWRAFWMAAPLWIRNISVPEAVREKMRYHLSHTPFCLKDPRFSVTLKCWEPLLPEDTRFLVVFRSAGKTAESMLREAHEGYTPPLEITFSWGLTLWLRTYRRLLKQAANSDRWFFVDSERLMHEAKDRAALDKFVGAKLDYGQLDPRIRRSEERRARDSRRALQCERLYTQLRQRADTDTQRWHRLSLESAAATKSVAPGDEDFHRPAPIRLEEPWAV